MNDQSILMVFWEILKNVYFTRLYTAKEITLIYNASICKMLAMFVLNDKTMQKFYNP